MRIDGIVRPAWGDDGAHQESVLRVARQHLERAGHADLHADHAEWIDDRAAQRYEGEQVGYLRFSWWHRALFTSQNPRLLARQSEDPGGVLPQDSPERRLRQAERG